MKKHKKFMSALLTGMLIFGQMSGNFTTYAEEGQEENPPVAEPQENEPETGTDSAPEPDSLTEPEKEEPSTESGPELKDENTEGSPEVSPEDSINDEESEEDPSDDSENEDSDSEDDEGDDTGEQEPENPEDPVLPDPNKGTGKRLDGDYAYLANVEFTKALTGTAPFDEVGESGEVQPGDDAGPDDNVLRTFDTAQYNFNFETHVRADAPYAKYEEGELYFEFVLPGKQDEIRFETSSMGWLETKNATYYISEESINGETCQVMRGHLPLVPSNGMSQGIGETEQELNVIFRALNMQNGKEVKPQFSIFLDHSDVGLEDYSKWGSEEYTGGSLLEVDEDYLCEEHQNKEFFSISADPIKISATPSYDIRIVTGNQQEEQARGTYDFSTGNDLAINKDKGVIQGRIQGFGLGVMVKGKSAQRGLRGIQLPDGDVDIDFDIKITSSFKPDSATQAEALVIDADENNPDLFPVVWSIEGNSPRNPQTDGRALNTSHVANNIMPLNKQTTKDYDYRSCFDGGNWSVVQDGDTLHVSVKGAKWNPEYLPYAGYNYGRESYPYYNPNQIENYWDVQEAYFSAGELWLVQPLYDKDGTYVPEKDGFGNGVFNVTLEDGVIDPETGENAKDVKVKIDETTATEPQAATDNDKSSIGLEVLKKGTMVTWIWYAQYKQNSTEYPLTSGALSTGKDWTMIGNNVSINGRMAQTAGEGENRIIVQHLMVKFDDSFFEANNAGEYGQWGDHILYYGGKKGGWDHQGKKPGEDGYDAEMKKATPADLEFFSSLEELEKAGYTCVAVLSETWSTNRETTNYRAIRVDGKVSETAEIGEVYMTCVYGQAWNIKNLADASGKRTSEILDMSEEERVALAKEYFPSVTEVKDNYNTAYPKSCYLNNAGMGKNGNEFNPDTGYIKAEYDESGYISHSEGHYNGDSCYLLGLETALTIEPEQPNGSDKKEKYDMDTGERIADFVVHPTIYRKKSQMKRQACCIQRMLL